MVNQDSPLEVINPSVAKSKMPHQISELQNLMFK